MRSQARPPSIEETTGLGIEQQREYKLPLADDETFSRDSVRTPPSSPSSSSLSSASLLSTIRFLFLSLAALRLQSQQLCAPTEVMRPPIAGMAIGQHERPINVLCLDGGGIKGRNLMVMVAEIEAACGRPVSEMFDLIAGTSIGGCGALFLSKFQHAAISKARRAFESLQNDCFRHQSVGRLLSRGYLCCNERPGFLRELVGAEPLSSDGPCAFAVAAREGESGLEPYLFRTYDHPSELSSAHGLSAAAAASASALRGGGAIEEGRPEGDVRASGSQTGAPTESAIPGTRHVPLSQAIMATSAAPPFFPRALIGESRFVDGGLVANDPTMLALREAASLWPQRALGLVVSLGTGTPTRSSEDGAIGVEMPAWRRVGRVLPNALKPLTELLLKQIGCADDPTATQRVAAAVQAVSPGARYFRFQPPIRCDVSPFESDEGKLAAMEEETRLHFRGSKVAAELCQELIASRSDARAAQCSDARAPHRGLRLTPASSLGGEDHTGASASEALTGNTGAGSTDTLDAAIRVSAA